MVVREVVRHIVAKVVLSIIREDIQGNQMTCNKITGEIKDVQICLANKAIATHSSLDAEWKAV